MSVVVSHPHPGLVMAVRILPFFAMAGAACSSLLFIVRSGDLVTSRWSSVGAHSFVVLMLMAVGIYAGYVTRNGGKGLVIAVFAGALHEIGWNVVAPVARGVPVGVVFTGYPGVVLIEVILLVILVAIWGEPSVRQNVHGKRLLLVMVFWLAFAGLWASIGFPTTLYNGPTVWFPNPFVNLIENTDWLVFLAGFVHVVRRF